MDDKKNNFRKKIIYVLLFIFIIMVGALVYFGISDKNAFSPKDDKDSEEPDIIEEPKETHNNMEANYFENFLNSNNINYLENGFNSIEDLSNQEKLKLLFLANNNYITSLEKISGEEVNDYFKKNYNTTVINENIDCNNEICYIYDEANDEYVENFKNTIAKKETLKNYINRKVYSKIVNYEQSSNTYTLTRYELYQKPCIECTLNTSYFASVKDANNDTDSLIEIPYGYTEEEIINYNKNKMYSLVFETNLSIYQSIISSHIYTFKRINNNYVLVSYIINGLD